MRMFLRAAIVTTCLYFTHAMTNNSLPELGRDIRSQFLFDPKYISLNHGAYGSMPKVLVPILQDLRMKAEANPDRWLRRDMFPELAKSQKALANLIHADPQELVFVFNAMTGVNTVARSLVLEPGDKILYVNFYFLYIFFLLIFQTSLIQLTTQ